MFSNPDIDDCTELRERLAKIIQDMVATTYANIDSLHSIGVGLKAAATFSPTARAAIGGGGFLFSCFDSHCGCGRAGARASSANNASTISLSRPATRSTAAAIERKAWLAGGSVPQGRRFAGGWRR